MTSIQKELQIYRPAILLDQLISRRARRRIRHVLAAVMTLLFLGVLGFVGMDFYKTGTFGSSAAYNEARYLTGSFFILAGIYGVLLLLSFYYNRLYYRGVRVKLSEDLDDAQGVTFEVGVVLSHAGGDLTGGFLRSVYGEEMALRAGVETTELERYLKDRRAFIKPPSFPLSKGRFTELSDLALYLYKEDRSFSEFLFKQGVPEEVFKGVVDWISRVRNSEKRESRWWSRENLGKLPGLGQEFSYGVAFELSRFTRNIYTTAVLSLVSNNSAYAEEIISKIEEILARQKASNVMLVGEPGVGKMDMLIELSKRMREGKTVDSVRGKHLIVFDRESFIGVYNSKQTFEAAFLKLMREAEHAGNIIIVIENIAAFLSGLEALRVDVADLLSLFLASPNVQLVATADPTSYHDYLESKPHLMQYFDPVIIERPELGSTVRVLEDALSRHEYEHNVFFTYPAIMRIAEVADQYIVEGVMPDKAVSLMAEVASRAGGRRIMTIWKEFVDECVSKKTGIPIGPVGDEEREMLLNLEDVLHKRVVGQEDAVKAVASTMRRARAGIQDKSRPMGSFLFLGSTGVGKTETAKALAEVFFGDEEKMIRFDMSEFSDEEALSRLLGDGSKPGELSNELRMHPYGVVLLDEFEKASEDVHDLFLQILDEGRFSDSVGRQVNARNTIIIATSNAGSDLIWQLTKEGKKPHTHKDTIIDTIISENIFKPELINRFDNVIVFETLSEKQQQRIAHLMLNDLKKRIHDKGYDLQIDDMFIELLVKKGYDPEFGARPMRRATQDIIEEKIASKIIEGGLEPGDTIHFTAEDFVN